jgi:hypothetical protein
MFPFEFLSSEAIALVAVGGLQQRPGRDDAGDLAGVAVVGLVLIGDGDPVAALD